MHNPRDSGAQAYLPLTYPDYSTTAITTSPSKESGL